MKNLFTLIFLMLSISLVNAQISTPAPSPAAKSEQVVGLTTVTLEYSRPGVKGRTIFAEDGLVPYGKMWRTGANAVSKISFSDDVKINGQDLSKGSYAILTIPTATDWTVNFYSYESSNWGSYRDKTPALSATATSNQMPMTVESMMLFVGELGMDNAKIQFAWENTYFDLDLEVAVDEQVMAAIEKTLSGPTAGDYYAAGNYMRAAGKDLNKALEYVQKATHVDEPRFWQVRTESLILAELGKHKEAIEVATKSMKLAEAAGNADYVAMNKKSIAEWKGKM